VNLGRGLCRALSQFILPGGVRIAERAKGASNV
jgi:hypothetical protein